MRRIDANVLTDALVDQGTASHDRSLSFVRQLLDGEEEVELTELALGEVLWFFRRRLSRYIPRDEVEQQRLPLVMAPAVHLQNRKRWATVLSLTKQSNLEVPDLYHLALSLDDGGEIYSYDTDLVRLAGVKRPEL